MSRVVQGTGCDSESSREFSLRHKDIELNFWRKEVRQGFETVIPEKGWVREKKPFYRTA